MFIDIILLLLIIAFSIFGVFEGFIVSIIKFGAWFFGVLAAWLFSGSLSVVLSRNIENLSIIVAYCIAALLLFFLVFIFFRIAAEIARYILKKLPPVSLVNRILGGVFGLLKGIIASIILLTFIHILPAKGYLKLYIDNSFSYSIYKSIPFVKMLEKSKETVVFKI